MNRIEFTRILSRNITVLFFGAMLASCGVGGDVAQTPGTALNGLAPVLRGVAAVGSPIVSGTVSVVCKTGVAITTTINAGDFPQTSPKTAGYWEVPTAGLTPPCAVQVSGGSINGVIVSGGTINAVSNTAKYHSLATSFGTVNITPLTDLIVANVVGRSNLDVWFTGLTPDSFTPTAVAPITQASVDTALNKLRTAFVELTPLSTTNPITTTFTPTAGNASDDMLVALKAAMTSATVTHADLLLIAAQPIFPAFPAPAALTTAFADTVSGGASPPVSGNINASGVRATTGIIATAGDGQVTITWNPVAGATSYNLYMNTQQGISPRTDPNKSVDLNVKSPFHKLGLTNNTPYFFVVTAVNVNGESGASSVVSAIPRALPSVTLTATPSSIASGATSTINWTSTNTASCISSGGGQLLLSTTTSGSATITSSALFGTVAVGDVVSGTGILLGSVVIAKASSSSLTINNNATSSGSPILLFSAAGPTGNFTTPPLTASTTYTVTCTGPDVTVTADQQSLSSIPTSGSDTITSAALFGTVAVGDVVSGTGIPAGSVVTAKTDSSSLTISNNATVSPTFTLSFGGAKPIVSTTTSGSPTITSAALFGPVVVGDAVSGTGIPPGSVVTGKSTPSNINISINATATGTSTLSFGGPKSISSITTAGLSTITSNALFGPVAVGDAVSGTGIPVGSVVSVKASSSSLTISNNATDSPTFPLLFVGIPTQRPKTITQSVTVTVAGLAELATFSSVTGGCVRDRPIGSGGLMWEVKTADGGLRDWRNSYTNYDIITLDPLAMQKYDPATGLFSNPTQVEIDAATNSVGFRDAVNAPPGLCGFTDWRLPTVGELQRIVKLGTIPTIDEVFFPNTQSNVYWSTTPVNPLGTATLCDTSPVPVCSIVLVQGNVSPAQAVFFYNGLESSFNRDRNLHVRLVRTVPPGQ